MASLGDFPSCCEAMVCFIRLWAEARRSKTYFNLTSLLGIYSTKGVSVGRNKSKTPERSPTVGGFSPTFGPGPIHHDDTKSHHASLTNVSGSHTTICRCRYQNLHCQTNTSFMRIFSVVLPCRRCFHRKPSPTLQLLRPQRLRTRTISSR